MNLINLKESYTFLGVKERKKRGGGKYCHTIIRIKIAVWHLAISRKMCCSLICHEVWPVNLIYTIVVCPVCIFFVAYCSRDKLNSKV